MPMRQRQNLPFADASFDLAVAYNVLMDVVDVAACLKEIRRVLRPHGQLVISIVHPFFDRGAFESDAPDAGFILRGTYFGRERFEGAEERDGPTMHFAGWSQPLENYFAALEAAGFAVTSLREPVPESGPHNERLHKFGRVPLFLWLKARTF